MDIIFHFENGYISHINDDEMWAVSLDDNIQIQAKNCKVCGNYLLSRIDDLYSLSM